MAETRKRSRIMHAIIRIFIAGAVFCGVWSVYPDLVRRAWRRDADRPE